MSLLRANAEFLNADFIPQAEIEVPEDQVRRMPFDEGTDDLDDFLGGAFRIGELVFTIKHYKHSAPNLYTVYFDRSEDIEKIIYQVKSIVESLGLPFSSLKWDRSMDPNL